jgi:hypothetical protein
MQAGLRALAAPLLLLAMVGQGPSPACARSEATPLVQSRPDQPRRSCAGGRDTVAFGRLLLDYGVATLKYGVGIVLIFLGLVVMALGYLLMLIDLLFCW